MKRLDASPAGYRIPGESSPSSVAPAPGGLRGRGRVGGAAGAGLLVGDGVLGAAA